jgi:hypothetical protein
LLIVTPRVLFAVFLLLLNREVCVPASHLASLWMDTHLLVDRLTMSTQVSITYRLLCDRHANINTVRLQIGFFFVCDRFNRFYLDLFVCASV